LGLATEDLSFCSLHKFSETFIDDCELGGSEFAALTCPTPNSLIDLVIDCSFEHHVVSPSAPLLVQVTPLGIDAALSENHTHFIVHAHVERCAGCLALAHAGGRDGLQQFNGFSCKAAFPEKPNGFHSLRVVLEQRNFLELNLRLSANFHGIWVAWCGFHGKLVGTDEIQSFQRQELLKELLVCFAVILEVFLLIGDIGSRVKNHRALVERMTWAILHDHTHDTADELHGKARDWQKH
jgi:hypothetical protein